MFSISSRPQFYFFAFIHISNITYVTYLYAKQQLLFSFLTLLTGVFSKNTMRDGFVLYQRPLTLTALIEFVYQKPRITTAKKWQRDNKLYTLINPKTNMKLIWLLLFIDAMIFLVESWHIYMHKINLF